MKALIKIPAVQTWLVQHVTNYLSDELKTKVSISHVDIKLFRSVELKDLYIEDLQHDTLLYAPVFTASFSQFSIKAHRLTIASVKLEKARIAIKFYKNPRDYNLDFIIDYFSGSGTDTTPSKPWKIKINKLELVDNTLSYRDLKYNDTTRCIDWDDIFLNHLNVELKNIIPDADTLKFDAKHISFKEKSGFLVSDFSASAKIAPKWMEYKKLQIITPYSELHSNVRFDFDSIDDFEDFITKVKWKGSFDKSKVAFNDLAYFASELFGLDRTITFKGDANGTVDRFKAKNLEINYTPTSFFKGNVNMAGLPDFDNTYMEVSVDDLSLNKKDIETIPAWPFENDTLINLPENLSALGTVRFKGKFNGFYNDFVAYGNTNTALGFISSDINLKIADNDRNTVYSGNLNLSNFDMGKLWKLDPDLGLVSMKAKIEGKGFELTNLDAKLEGEVSAIQLYKYNYSNIKLNGHIGKRLFNGEVSINDPNLDLDFQGDIDLRSKMPIYNFTSSIRTAKVSVMNLIDRDTSANLSAEISINMIGNNIDNAEGTIQVEDVHYSEKGDELRAERLFLDSRIGERRELSLTSDFANAQIVGNYNLSDFLNSARWIVSRYIPAVFKENKARPPYNQNISFRVETKNTKPLTQIFLPALEIARGSVLEGKLNTDLSSMMLLFTSNQMLISGTKLNNIYLSGNTQENQLMINTTIGRVELSDSLQMDSLHLSGSTNRDSSDIVFSMKGDDPSVSQAELRFDTHFMNTGYTTVKLIPSKLLLNRSQWTIDPENYLLIDSTGVLFNKFRFNSGNQSVNIAGIIGKDTTGRLQLTFHDFESSILNSVLTLFDAEVGGVANGNVSIAGLLGKPTMNADLQVDQLRWFSDTLGNAQMTSRWKSDEGFIDVKAVVTRGGDKNILVDGKYYLKEKDDLLDFHIKLQKTYIASFAHYVDGLFSNLSGIASADLHLSGPVKKPNLTGKAHLQKVSFMVDYLKTTYNFSAEADLDENSISFRDIILNDIHGNQAIATGKISHDHLRDFYFDIDIRAKNTQVLSTTFADNELFYGNAYATGNIAISGYTDYINMNIGLKSEKGTKINIPLSNPEEISKSSFITFIKVDSTKKDKVIEGMADFSGVALNMDFEMTPDANIALIFDSKIGDVIEGTGHGNISMTVSPTEDFKMFGTYEIERGKYLFTMQNIINKDFTIEKGGFIRWNGDPYDAQIKINATYPVNVSLNELLQDSSYKKLVPVSLQLRLSDKLFNPNIAFDINVQNVDPTLQSQIQRLINTEEEKFNQAVSLLVMRRFLPPEEGLAGVNTSGVVGANAYELLSNQLSNWVSQLSNQVNIGVDYTPGGQVTGEEVKVLLSTSILKDRVNIDGNFGYANNVNAANQNTSNLVGDFNVEVKASEDGRVKLKAFNRSNNNSLINNVNSPYTQGVGVFYREEFNNFSDLTKRFKAWIRRKKDVAPADSSSSQRINK